MEGNKGLTSLRVGWARRDGLVQTLHFMFWETETQAAGGPRLHGGLEDTDSLPRTTLPLRAGKWVSWEEGAFRCTLRPSL